MPPEENPAVTSDPAVAGNTTQPPEAPAADPPVQESLLGGEPKAPEPEPFDPEKIEFPEGFEKTEHFDQFADIAKKHGLHGPAAQDLINLSAQHAKALVDKQHAEWRTLQDKWQAEVKADSEIGGDKLDGVLADISKVLDNPAFAASGFREAMVMTGAGNHPAVIKTFAKIAKALAEGVPAGGNVPLRGPEGAPQGRPSLADSLYGGNG